MGFANLQRVITGVGFAVLGDDAIYRPKDGLAKPCKAIVNHETKQGGEQPATHIETITIVKVPVEVAPAPQRGDEVDTVEGTYAVDYTVKTANGRHWLMVHRV